ncbi:MAG: DsbA family protein [Patescibacteria group bacterium]
MKNTYIIAIAIVIAGAMISGTFIYLERTDEGTSEQEARVAGSEEKEETEIDAREINIEGWPQKGDPDAPVVVVEYSDYVCPFCKRLKDNAISSIEEEYVESGEVLLVFKDLPVVGGDRAAEAAHCAGEQDAYWDYHDILFENQQADRAKWDDSEVHRDYADEIGIDDDELVECFEDRKYQQKVIDSTREARSLGGEGTPYIIVNDQVVSGAQSYQIFERIIESYR